MEGSQIQVQEELLLAKQSRLEGNEGRARVCARRAAGASVQTYLESIETPSKNENAIQSLIRMEGLESVPDRVKTAIKWLVMRVNEDHSFPPDVDLIHEAGIVINYVEGKAHQENE